MSKSDIPVPEIPPFARPLVDGYLKEIQADLQEKASVIWRNGVAVQIVDNTQTASNGVVR